MVVLVKWTVNGEHIPVMSVEKDAFSCALVEKATVSKTTKKRNNFFINGVLKR